MKFFIHKKIYIYAWENGNTLDNISSIFHLDSCLNGTKFSVNGGI